MKYPFKTKPYKHQVQGMRFAFQQFDRDRGAAFLFEPRTGKTKTTIDTLAALYLKHDVRRVLVVAPNRVLGTWVNEFHIHSPLNVQCIIWDARGRKQPLPRTIGPYDMQVVIINFEAFGTPGRKTKSGRRSRASGRFAHRTAIKKWVGNEPAAAVIDEGHKIKSASGKVSTAIVSMRDYFEYRLLLTGTPITKARRAHDIFMLWQWVNPARFVRWGPTAETFRNHVGVWTERNGFPQWLRERKTGMADLQRGLHQDGLVIRREDCFDLPARMPDRILPVRLNPRTRVAYEEMAEEMVTEIENGLIAEASIPLVVTLRLQQITSGFVGITPAGLDHRGRAHKTRFHRIGTEKLEALRELVMEEYIDREVDEKFVVAAKYRPDLDDITRMMAALKVPMWSIRGGMHREETDESIRRFRKHRGMACMLIQPDAASLGIDLSTASHMIWYSLTSSWVNWTQSCDRIALSDQSTSFTYLQVPGSVDALLYESLLNDTNVSRAILTHPEKLRLHHATSRSR